ncbi:DUF1987 domain-containing protein [Xanthovirga aplysinae]|uniref:DUF1987 domain-containing protein n=1 Tax=Xanthovirga aplysinae TaxID=2529853 RepID=UPI0012BCB0F1|nr:DUF1987 domain-containing protein [Xanthovirga aplysinae]MTI31105.1 DUF1987 domain-containing protein [Xanthovirga aplysinae]
MKSFYLEPTPKTPKIHFDCTNGQFELSGRSIPENSIEFYQPVLDWLDECLNSSGIAILFHVQLEYFNTSSSKCIVEIFRKLEQISKEGREVHVKWHYEEEDEDMFESGEDFKEIVHLPIELVMMKEES